MEDFWRRFIGFNRVLKVVWEVFRGFVLGMCLSGTIFLDAPFFSYTI